MYSELLKLQKDIEKQIEILKAFEVPFSPVYGSFYCEDAAINVTAVLAHNYYPVTSGMTVSLLWGGITFSAASQLNIRTAGVYQVDWSMSIAVNNPNETIEGLVFSGVAGNTPNLNTVNANRAAAAAAVVSVSGHGLITCAVGDIIRLGVENETSAGKVITVNHANFVLKRIR